MMNNITNSSNDLDTIKVIPPDTTTATENKPHTFLQDDVTLVLHTRLALTFIQEHDQYKAPLLLFSNKMRKMWRASHQDDPYADWYIIKTYHAYHQAHEALQKLETECNSLLHSLRGFEIQLCENKTPVRYPMVFRSPFAFMGATLVTDLDYVLRQVVTLKRLGYAQAVQAITVPHLAKLVFTVLRSPIRWHITGITRKDVREQTEKYIQAKTAFGKLPKAVLDRQAGKNEFAYWPALNAVTNIQAVKKE